MCLQNLSHIVFNQFYPVELKSFFHKKITCKAALRYAQQNKKQAVKAIRLPFYFLPFFLTKKLESDFLPVQITIHYSGEQSACLGAG